MKKLILVACFIIANTAVLQAQNEIMNIYDTSGTIVVASYPTSTVNKVTVTGTGTAETMNVYDAAGAVVQASYLTSAVSKVTFTQTPLAESISICAQQWATRNLDVTTYSDGTPIPQVTDPTAWAALTTGAWCYYNNSAATNATYGKLYNWYAAAGIYDAASLANPALRKKLAPTGWHVPTDVEWTTLTTCLGGLSVAGGKMKETGTTHWMFTNTGATNSSGFTALPGGFCNHLGAFYFMIGSGFWWSSSEYSTTNAWSRSLTDNSENVGRFNTNKFYGYSMRCLRD